MNPAFNEKADIFLLNFGPSDDKSFGEEQLEQLSHCLINYVDMFNSTSRKKANAWLSLDKNKAILDKCNIERKVVTEVVAASKISDGFEQEITNMALRVLDILISNQKEEGYWKLFDFYHKKGMRKLSNARITATCMYSIWKSFTFLKKLNPDLDIEPATKAIENGIRWLFSDKAFCYTKDGMAGWNQLNSLSTRFNNNIISLYDTCYTLNILIRIAPNSCQNYENVLNTIITWPHKTESFWKSSELSGEKDIVATSYVLRVISNYINHYEIRNKATKGSGIVDKDRLLKTREALKKTLLNDKGDCDFWPSGNKRFSDITSTALTIHALRTSGVPRYEIKIGSACNWLLNKIKFHDGSWCWTEIENNHEKKSPYESSLCVSALLKSTTFEKFYKAEVVILWMLNEIKRNNFNESIYFASILCTFSDYLRAFQEPGFFD